MLLWPGAEEISYAFVMCGPDALTQKRLDGLEEQLREEVEAFRDILVLLLGSFGKILGKSFKVQLKTFSTQFWDKSYDIQFKHLKRK